MNVQPKTSWPSWKQAVLLILGGIVFATSFCAGFSRYVGFVNGTGAGNFLTYTLAGGFFISVTVFLSGIVALVIRIIRDALGK